MWRTRYACRSLEATLEKAPQYVKENPERGVKVAYPMGSKANCRLMGIYRESAS